jgi:putative endonuclease
MDKTKNKKTGNTGEDLAVGYLKDLKYTILGRNISYPFGEIDILAENKGTIVIVEVKTVLGSGWGSAHDLVRRKKQEKLRLLALQIMNEHPQQDVRIDVIAINQGEIEHVINAVEEK